MYGLYSIRREDGSAWANLERLACAPTLAEANRVVAEDCLGMETTICSLNQDQIYSCAVCRPSAPDPR